MSLQKKWEEVKKTNSITDRLKAFNEPKKEENKEKPKEEEGKTKSKNHFNKNDNDLNNLIINGKYNNNSNNQKSFKEKMDSILSKNIIALTKKKRKKYKWKEDTKLYGLNKMW